MVLIQSIPSHILKPEFYYDIIVYQNLGSSSPLITLSAASKLIIKVWSGIGYDGYSTQYYDTLPVHNYLSSSAFTLNNIYFLTREATITNSLLIDFTVTIAAPATFFL